MITFPADMQGSLGAISQLDGKSCTILSGLQWTENKIKACCSTRGDGALRRIQQLQDLQCSSALSPRLGLACLRLHVSKLTIY